MTVSTIATIASGLSRNFATQSTKPSSVLDSLFVAVPKSDTSDVTNLSATLTLQNQVAQFRIVSQNVAHASSLLATAGNGANEVSRSLNRMKELADKASSTTLSAGERELLNSEFQSIRQKIDTIARNTRFGNESLLDGTSSQLHVAAETKDMSVGSLTDAALFKGVSVDLLSVDHAKAAQTAVDAASTYTAAQVANIASLESGLDYALAAVQSAIQNHDASRAGSDEINMISQLLDGKSALQSNDHNSLFAQTNRMPNNLLGLLGE